jgi:hypothetical protein
MSLEKLPEARSRREVRLARRGHQRLETYEEAERDAESVQRVIISTLVGLVFGSIAVVLAAYISVWGARDLSRSDILVLWVMSGVIGLVTAVAVLVVQQRRPYSPWAVLGLVPMAISAFWIFS